MGTFVKTSENNGFDMEFEKPRKVFKSGTPTPKIRKSRDNGLVDCRRRKRSLSRESVSGVSASKHVNFRNESPQDVEFDEFDYFMRNENFCDEKVSHI